MCLSSGGVRRITLFPTRQVKRERTVAMDTWSNKNVSLPTEALALKLGLIVQWTYSADLALCNAIDYSKNNCGCYQTSKTTSI